MTQDPIADLVRTLMHQCDHQTLSRLTELLDEDNTDTQTRVLRAGVVVGLREYLRDLD